MSNQVIVVNETEMKKVMNHYKSFKVYRNAPGVVFAAKTTDTAITIYKSGKVLFQGKGAQQEAIQWDADSATKTTPSNTSNPSTLKNPTDCLPSNLANLSVIGSDETGTGDFFGPVTVAACYVPASKIELIKELGVKDSKLLTDSLMREIAPDLQATLIYSVLTLDNIKYNEIQAQGNSQGKIKAMLHNQAIKLVLKKMAHEKPTHILIDQFAQRNTYYNYLKDEQEIVRENVLFATKAEGLHVAVAAASIIARVAFLEKMDELSSSVGVELPKGAGSKVDEVAARVLLKNGECTLKDLTKWHFANAEKAKKIAQKKRNRL